MNTHSQHKDILFLVSLSPEIIADLEKKEIDISYYLNKIKSFTNVDYRETISRENLAIANQYKVVIVVGHRKGDSLELSNRSLFPLADIVTSLPSDFSGVIDVAVCNSTVIHDAIKKRCPNALVLTAYNKTGVDFWIPFYSILLKKLPTDINYRCAYLHLLRRMEVYQNDIPETESANSARRFPEVKLEIEREAGDDGERRLSITSPLCNGMLALVPTIGAGYATIGAGYAALNALKQKIVSISSPAFVTRGYTFLIQVFLHYDSEKGTIKVIAKGRDHDTKSPLQLKTIKDIHKGDKIEIKLSMMDVAIQPTNLILVCDKEHSYTKSITISDESIDEVFKVCVTKDYYYSECWARLEIRKSDASDIIMPFDFKITIKEEDSQHSNNTEKQHSYNERLANVSNLAEKQNMNLDVKPETEDMTFEGATHNEQPDNTVPKCFKFDSELVRQKVKAIVSEFYLGKAANLALIEIAFCDHSLISTRNSHKAFIETLVAWGAINCADVENTANAMSNKMGKVPKYGYKDWNGDRYVNDKKTCTDICKKLGPTIPYSR